MFTASEQVYADNILNRVDPNMQIYDRLYRHNLTWKRNIAYKDVTKYVKDISHCLIIDDKTDLTLQRENLMKIKPFYGDIDKDDTLKSLADFLTTVVGEKEDIDMREVAKRYEKEFYNNIA